MLRALFISNIILILTAFPVLFTNASTEGKEVKKAVITSQTLTADNKSNTVIFEGDVKTIIYDMTIYSDKMTVFYSNSESKITKIHAAGSVKVHKEDSVIFSKEAVYFGDEEKIIFTGEPKMVDGENVITGRQIIHFLKSGRTVVEESRVVLKIQGEKSNAFLRDQKN